MEQFRNAYEKSHVPLVFKHVTNIRKYVRNYVRHETARAEVPYDCITEVWLDSMKDYENFIAKRDSDTEAGLVLRSNIADVFDKSVLRLFFCADETSSILAEDRPRPTAGG